MFVKRQRSIKRYTKQLDSIIELHGAPGHANAPVMSKMRQGYVPEAIFDQ